MGDLLCDVRLEICLTVPITLLVWDCNYGGEDVTLQSSDSWSPSKCTEQCSARANCLELNAAWMRSLGKGAGHLSRLEAWTTALEADIYKVGHSAQRKQYISHNWASPQIALACALEQVPTPCRML